MGLDRILRGLRPCLEPDEAVMASVAGRSDLGTRTRPVTVVVTDRRVMVAARHGAIQHQWSFDELRPGGITIAAANGVLRIASPSDTVEVRDVASDGGANAIVQFARERSREPSDRGDAASDPRGAGGSVDEDDDPA